MKNSELRQIIREEIKLMEDATSKNPIDGHTKQNAKRKLYKMVSKYTKGVFRDNSWENVRKVWNEFEKNDIDIDIVKSNYNPGGLSVPEQWKKWEFEIPFLNDKSKVSKIGGYLMASAAGSVKDPMDAYDIVVIFY